MSRFDKKSSFVGVHRCLSAFILFHRVENPSISGRHWSWSSYIWNEIGVHRLLSCKIISKSKLTCLISSLLHFVNLIVFTVLLAHLILRISPHHSHHLRSHHLSLPRPFTPDLKLISFTNPFFHIVFFPSGLPSRILNLYWTMWALAFVCFNFVC